MRPLRYYDILNEYFALMRAPAKKPHTPVNHAVEPERDYKINSLRPSETWYQSAQVNPQPENPINTRIQQAKSGSKSYTSTGFAGLWKATMKAVCSSGASPSAPQKPEFYGATPKKPPEYMY
jgi:hypothetical protein